MALRDGSEGSFTKWMHMENGKVLVRRLHRLEIQSASGQLHVLTGSNLPDAIVTNSGEGFKGAHLGQILLKPKQRLLSLNSLPEYKEDRWPTSRDAIQWIIAFAFVLFLNFWTHAEFSF